MTNGSYCRIGLVFVVNPDPEADATTDAGVAMLRAFSFITKLHTPTKGLSFITDVRTYCQCTNTQSITHYKGCIVILYNMSFVVIVLTLLENISPIGLA